jgi:hypothetical protein
MWIPVYNWILGSVINKLMGENFILDRLDTFQGWTEKNEKKNKRKKKRRFKKIPSGKLTVRYRSHGPVEIVDLPSYKIR